MSVRQIYEKLLHAKRPIEFFGAMSTNDELKKVYKQYAKKIHPDVVPDKDKYIAGEAFAIMGKLYKLGLSELTQGIYATYDSVQIYRQVLENQWQKPIELLIEGLKKV